MSIISALRYPMFFFLMKGSTTLDKIIETIIVPEHSADMLDEYCRRARLQALDALNISRDNAISIV